MPIIVVDPRIETETPVTEPSAVRDGLAERQRHDDDLRRFGAVMEASGDAVVVVDPQRMVLVLSLIHI